MTLDHGTRRSHTQTMRARWLVAVLFIGLWAGLVAFTYTSIVPPRDMRFDFTPRYFGGIALWQGQSPYAPEVSKTIQDAILGGMASPDAGRHRMYYPAYVGLLLAPLLTLPFDVSVSVWMALQLFCVLVTPVIWAMILGWQPKPLTMATLVLGFTIIFRYPINLYVVGQFTGTMLLGFTAAFALLLRRRDAAAGIVLACTAVPPQIAGVAALLLLGGYAVIGRWRGLVAFAMTLGLLTAITWLQIGWWIPDFIQQVREYPLYNPVVWTPDALGLPLLRPLLIAAVVGVLLAALVRFRRQGKHEELDWFAMSLLMPLLLLVPTGNYYLVLVIPVALIALWHAQGRRFSWLVWVGTALLIVSPWAYRETAFGLEMVLVPLHVAVLLFIARIHPSPVPVNHKTIG